MLSVVPVRKPDGQEFVRTHPDEQYRLEVGLIFFQEDRKLYLVDRALHQALGADVKRKLLVTTVTTQDVMFLWPLNLSKDGKENSWNDTALVAAKTAECKWTRVISNHGTSQYDTYTVIDELKIPEPDWPTLLQGKSFTELLEIAFPGDRYIDSTEHVVVQKLTGRVV